MDISDLTSTTGRKIRSSNLSQCDRILDNPILIRVAGATTGARNSFLEERA